MIQWLIQHPEVKEERGNDPLIVGKVALRYLSKVTTRCEIDELLWVALSSKNKIEGQFLSFPTLASGVSLFPTHELDVRSIINFFYRVASERLNPAAGDARAMHTDEEIIAGGLKEAFRSHQERLKNISSAAHDYWKIIDADN